MPELVWSEEYSVHVPEIDEQHKKLFELAHNLRAANHTQLGRAALADTLDALIAYATTHFATEEALMMKINYPNTAGHLRQHADFINRLFDFQADYMAGKAGLTISISEFVENWISNHILSADKKYSNYLKTLS